MANFLNGVQAYNESHDSDSNFNSSSYTSSASFADMLAYSQLQSFQSTNNLDTSMTSAAATMLQPSSGDTSSYGSDPGMRDNYNDNNSNHNPGIYQFQGYGGGSGHAWQMQMPFEQLQGRSNMRNGQPTPPEDQSGSDGVKEEDTTSRKRSRASTSKGRKSRKSSKIEEEHLPNLGLDDVEQREKFLERNRVAASKCRQKKKVWTNNLEERARQLQRDREYLVTQVGILRNELLQLKCKCLDHAECDCERLREYLMHTIAALPPAPAGLAQADPFQAHLLEAAMRQRTESQHNDVQPTSNVHSRRPSVVANVDYFPLNLKVEDNTQSVGTVIAPA